MRITRRTAVAVVGSLAALGAIPPALGASSSGPAAPSFSKPVVLKGYAGGEPSLALDPYHSNDVYVVAPQAIPSAANNALWSTGLFSGPTPAAKGVGFWASHDGGRTFPVSANIGSSVGGGDSDVIVGSDGTVYVADLEAAGTSICTSTNRGKSFTSGNALSSADTCNGVTTNQQGPDNDRQWLNVQHGQGGDTVYLTYHDFAGGFPIMESSTDHGQTFAPCGTILNPNGPAGQNYSPSNGTLVAKPAIDKDGRVIVEVTEPALVSPPVGAALNSLYIAVADKGCNGGTVFKNYKIYSDPGADLGKIFNSVTVDGAGNIYVIAAGKTKANQTTTNVWLFVSRDHGAHWTAPIKVNTPNLKANVMPAVAGGLRGNQLAVGWFGTSTNGDPNYQKNQWRYYVSTTFDGGKHFAQTTVTPQPIHYGDICTQGLFCGLIPGEPGNRNLADFDELAVDPRTGKLIVAFPGDPYNRPDLPNGKNTFGSSAYVVRQVGGKPLN